MATSPVPLWVQEMSPYYRGPTAAGVLTLAVVVVVLVVLLLSGAAAVQGGESAGPRWQSPACVELQRLQRHGVASGPSYRLAARACREASGGR